IDQEELFVVYQPQIRLADGRIAGMEALARWRHPERGVLLPDRFIPLAEETGLIAPLGAWVLRRACREAARWPGRQRGAEDVTLAVNLSPRQLTQPDLVSQVASSLEE